MVVPYLSRDQMKILHRVSPHNRQIIFDAIFCTRKTLKIKLISKYVCGRQQQKLDIRITKLFMVRI